MKIPEKLVPLLLGLVVVAAFLVGRLQAQVEFLKGGSSSGSSLAQNTGQQAGQGTEPVVGQKAEVQGAQEGQPLSDEQWQRVVSGAVAEKGEAGAPVTVVEFTDYQCPFCERFFNETYSQLEDEYIKTGKVRYLIRDFPLPFHGNAVAAAMAARCAGDQNSYWELHDELFKGQSDWSSGDPTDTFVEYAGNVGIDTSTFSACLAEQKYKDAVDADYALAQELGAGGTPAFFINGKLLVGAQPFSAFQKEIDSNL